MDLGINYHCPLMQGIELGHSNDKQRFNPSIIRDSDLNYQSESLSSIR